MDCVEGRIELRSFTPEEIALAAAYLSSDDMMNKRRIIVSPDVLSTIESKLRYLPDSPGLPKGALLPGVAGYLYNIPVFVEKDSTGSYMI